VIFFSWKKNFFSRKAIFQIFGHIKRLLQKSNGGIRDPEKTYSGSRIRGAKRYRIPDPDPQHCFEVRKIYRFMGYRTYMYRPFRTWFGYFRPCSPEDWDKWTLLHRSPSPTL
jgi:hypothetical protein